jgi:predicted flap endonuclease-1-like 5' DNA nuclease
MLDIQAIIDIMQTNIIIPVSVSLLIGIIGSWLLFRPKVSKRDKYITELEKSTKKNAKQLKNQNESIKQYETALETLNDELSDRENTIEDRENTIENAREKINELSARAKEIIFLKDRHIETLNTSLADKDKNFMKLTKRVQVMESNEKKGRLELNKQVETITGLQSQLVERSDQMASLKGEMADLNNLMQKNIGERDINIDTLSDTVEANNERIGILTERLQVKDEAIQIKQDQISKKEEDIQEQKEKFNEQSLYIKNMTEEKDDLQEQIQKIMIRAEDAEAREIEMGSALKTKDLEFASLHQRTRRMQDDFTHLAGIGQKISSILKNAGIKSFSKLAETDVKHINEILEKRNLSLLKKTDPTTWPEQARIAAEGDWEALANLQKSMKTAKS